jgi:CubicO group peptidase (beta-lactamase class C family)
VIDLKHYFFTGFVILSLISIYFAQGNEAKLPDTAAGKRAEAYFAAFNSGDEEKVKAFFLDNASEESLKQRPIEARLDFYRQMRSQQQSLTLRRVLEARNDRISTLVQNRRGEWLRFDFIFEPVPPHKMVGIGIDEAQNPENEVSLPASLSKAQLTALLDERINKLAADDEFSGVVLIAKKDQPVYQKAVGLASKEFNVPNRIDTKFNLGSINKLFTQIAIAQLVAAGKLSYEEKLGKVLPDYPNKDAAAKITIKHLLTMTSGIGDFFGDRYDAMSKDLLRSNKDFLTLFAAEPLKFEPGSKQEYSNGGYVVLGAIIEKLSGTSYYEYVRKNIFQPAGMMDTDSFSTNEIVPNLAQGYTREGINSGDKKSRRSNVLIRPARGSAAGGGYSTALDLLKLSVALQSGKLRQYDLSSPNGQAVKAISLGVAGGAPGINALFELDVEKGYTIIVLSNYDPESALVVGRFARNLISKLTE